VIITAAIYQGGPLPPRRLTQRASLEETAWLIQWCGLAIAIGKCHFEAIECRVGPKIVHWGETWSQGGTGRKLPGSASPTFRRRELGALLKALRTEKGWTVEQVAEHLEFSPSKVSRLETGHRGASARDIRDLCDLFGVHDQRRQQLLDLAAAGKQQAWWQARNISYSRYVGLEAAATVISDFGLGVVPGLLQTADYARAVLRSTRPGLDESVIEERLASRLLRQQLLTQDDAPRFEAVIEEGVMHRVAGSSRIMHAQLDRLIEVSELPRFDIRLLPYASGLMPSSINKFILLTFPEATGPEIVFIEHLAGDLYLEGPDDVAAYQETFSVMREMAASPDRSRDMLRAIARAL
jgi:transcriptional regulator with XRE-family HTH domain